MLGHLGGDQGRARVATAWSARTDKGNMMTLPLRVTDLALERIERAASTIDAVFRDSPQFVDEQLCAALGRRVLVKVETVNPLRSFKGRGADFLVRGLDKSRRVVCASSGNFGQALTYSGVRRGIEVRVFVPADANRTKLARLRTLGGLVTQTGVDFDTAKEIARDHAGQHPGYVYIEDGAVAAVAEGAGTIGVELMQAGPLDAVVVPVGGALISGVGRWIKEHSPHTRIVGVCARGAPAMAESWRTGKPVSTERVDTIADGIRIRVPVPEAVAWMRQVVDDVVLVEDAALLDGVRLAAEALGLVLEPAGAAGLRPFASTATGCPVIGSPRY